MWDDVWKYIFVMYHALYAPKYALCLADKKTPAMGKLYFYVLQTNCKELDEQSNTFLTMATIMSMNTVPSARESNREGDDKSTEDEFSDADDQDDSDDDDDNDSEGGGER